MKQIESYVPEINLLDRKDRFPARLCREDCAVLDAAAPDRMLACRLGRGSNDTTFSSTFGVCAEDMRFLHTHLAPRRLLILGGARAPILVSADLLDSAGVLLALSPERADPAAFLRALTEVLSDVPILLAPSLQEIPFSAHASDPRLTELICEWRFYCSRICSNRTEIGLRTRAMLIANFTGCHTETDSVPVEKLSLPLGEWRSVAAFLLCVFLDLRQQSGEIASSVDSTERHTPAFRVSVRTPAAAAHTGLRAWTCASFLSHPAFQRFRASWTPDGLCFEVSLLPAAPSGHLRTDLASPKTSKLVFFFQKITQNDLNS